MQLTDRKSEKSFLHHYNCLYCILVRKWIHVLFVGSAYLDCGYLQEAGHYSVRISNIVMILFRN